MGRARLAPKPTRSLALLSLHLVCTWAFPSRPLRRGGGRCPQGCPIQSRFQPLPHGVGGGARETRAARRSESCCDPRLGITAGVPLQSEIGQRKLRNDTCSLSGGGAPCRRVAGITAVFFMPHDRTRTMSAIDAVDGSSTGTCVP